MEAHSLVAERGEIERRDATPIGYPSTVAPADILMRTPPLSREQAREVLRYWLASLRLEEALSLRPLARRASRADAPPRLDVPSPGQVYFKLPLDGATAQMLAGDGVLSRPLDGELSAFFEDWLHMQYRRADDGELTHLVCFPVVHLPRGELAGLLRAEVRVGFFAEGKPFEPPAYPERRAGTYPAAPTEARVSRVAAESWPFFLDPRLLARPLGITAEDIDALFDALRERETPSALDMLALVTETLERTASPEARAPAPRTIEAALERLQRAMHELLSRAPTRAKVYPVGVVLDATRAKATWHLQRELTSLIEGSAASKRGSGLDSYLTGRAAPAIPDGTPQRALGAGPALTARQRRAADAFWSSTLTAVQGPPGTGKTTLILHLCAEALVRQVDALVDQKQMGGDLFVVTSSNNRAVDNVIEPLDRAEGLPLALRVGNRQVTSIKLAAQLRRTLAWLESAKAEPASVHQRALEDALARFSERRAIVDAILAPQREHRSRAEQRARVERSLAELDDAPPAIDACWADLTAEQTTTLVAALKKLDERAAALSRMCEPKPSAVRLAALTRYYAQTVEPALTALERVSGARLELDWPLPPETTSLDVVALTEAWEEAAELARTRVGELCGALERHLVAARRAKKARKLRGRLAQLGTEPPSAEVAWDEHEQSARELFDAAVQAREAWARSRATELTAALETALRFVTEERSLRPLFRHDPEAAARLCQLFAIWGSTLLSLGNCLSPDAGSVARVVIDEAGQCHPAHAVSALMRSRSTLIVGDVHQLTPVIELGADDDERLIRSKRIELAPEMLAPYRTHRESVASVQSLAERAVPERHALLDHFRCHPAIIAISDALCAYGLDVHTPRPLESGLLPHPVASIDVRGAQEAHFGSWYNELELRETLALLDRLLASGRAPSGIAVITPYRAQLERLRRGVVERGIPLEPSLELAELDEPPAPSMEGLALGTVHRFQGGERSVVLFTTVATRARSLSFLNARPNLLNVAVSRARDHFVCIGDRRVLALGERTRLVIDAAEPLTPLVRAGASDPT